MIVAALNLESQFQIDEDTPSLDAAMGYVADAVANTNKEWCFERDGQNGVIRTKRNKFRVCYRNNPTPQLGNRLSNSIVVHYPMDNDPTYEMVDSALKDMIDLRNAAHAINKDRPWTDYMTISRSSSTEE